MRGRRPSPRANSSTSAWIASNSASPSVRAAVDARDRADARAVAPEDLLERVGDLADRRPRTRRLDRQLEQVARRPRPQPRSAPRARPCAGPGRVVRLISSSRAICCRRTSLLSMSRTSIGDSSASRYLFTPTIVSSPRSTRAWRRAAASSMRSFGMPDSTALVMPPSCSTSSMSFHASSASEWVSAST